MSARDGLRVKTVSAIIWKFAERCVFQVAGLATQVILARLLSPSDFGAMAILLVFMALANSIVQSGLSNALVQAEKVTKRDYSSVLTLSLVLATVMYAILFTFSPIIASFYSTPELALELKVLGLNLFVGSFQSVQVAHATRELNTKALLRATLVGSIVSGATAIIFAVLGAKIWALIVQNIVLMLVCSIVLSRSTNWNPFSGLSLNGAGKFWRFGWRIMASGLIFNLYQNIFDLIVGKSFSTKSLGFFSQGRKIPYLLFNSFDGSIQTVMLSSLSKLQNDRYHFKKALRRSIKTSVFLVSPLLLFLAACASQIVPVVFGEQWIESVPFFSMFALGYSLASVSSSNQQALNANGRSDLFLAIEIIKAVVGLTILGVALALFHSVFWMSVAASIALIVSVFINIIPNSRILNYGVREQLHDIVPTYALGLVSSTVVFFMAKTLPVSFASLFICLVAMVIVYCGAAFLTKNESAIYIFGILREYISRKKGETSC